MNIHQDILNAYKVLDGETLTRLEALRIAKNVRGTDLLDLVSLANKVRSKFSPEFGACSIINAKSGRCSQNCRFCAQSAHYDTGIETYGLLPPEKVLANAREVLATGITTYGYVTSGCGYLGYQFIISWSSRSMKSIFTPAMPHRSYSANARRNAPLRLTSVQ